VNKLTSSLPLTADHDFVSPDVNLENLQRARRRAGDISSIEIV
jgi:hypothetical protein